MKYTKCYQWLAIAVATVLLGTLIPMTSYAQESSVICLDVQEDTSQYEQIYTYLEEHGKEVLENYKMRSSVSLGNITRLAQADSRWANEVIQEANAEQGIKEVTIGSGGCCLTSFTIVRNCISNTSDTPSTVHAKLGSAACPFSWSTAATTYGYTILTGRQNDNGISDESARLTVVGAIDEYCLPVIIGMKYSGGTHFVVGYGYTSDGDIIICDPAGRNYTRFSQYTEEGYYVHRLYIYSK